MEGEVFLKWTNWSNYTITKVDVCEGNYVNFMGSLDDTIQNRRSIKMKLLKQPTVQSGEHRNSGMQVNEKNRLN